MDDYTQHPLWDFSQNHPESPDVFDERPLSDSMVEDAFDGGSLRFQERMMLCMDSIRELQYEQECDLSPRFIIRMTEDWSLDAVDRVMVLDDVLMFLDIQEDIASFLDSKGGE
jgi:hypothetical protein